MEALGDDVNSFETDVANALIALESCEWDKDRTNPPLKPHGRSGRDFSYPINTEFVLIVRRDTDRVEHKPRVVHLYLKTIAPARA